VDIAAGERLDFTIQDIGESTLSAS
jgi:hypothetical protein